MFYCEPCRLKSNWPRGFGTSYGPCELCHKTTECYERRAADLPDDEPEYTQAEIKAAFWRVFHKSGELWFPYWEYDEEHNTEVTEDAWQEFLEALEGVADD